MTRTLDELSTISPISEVTEAIPDTHVAKPSNITALWMALLLSDAGASNSDIPAAKGRYISAISTTDVPSKPVPTKKLLSNIATVDSNADVDIRAARYDRTRVRSMTVTLSSC